MQIGFVGLGKMGAAIARNLLRAGHRVTLYNRTRDKAEALSSEGARVANSPAEAAQDSEAVFTMLSDDHAVDEIVFGDRGIASGLKNDAAHVSSSTISVAFARHLNAAHAERRQAFVSAPVFGRPEAAENKKLIVLAAGATEIVERFRPLFDAIGRQTFIAGSEPWQANAVKLCGNFMIGSMLETFGEAFAAMRKADISHHLFLEVMNELFGSPVYRNYGTTIANENFDPAGFALRLGLKDVRLVLQMAEEFSVPMPFASVLRDHLISGMANGQDELDWSSI
ncbi:MAG: NAD(P)-dependent oxidoreductase, partial [Acidobacteriaceae bacterium]|nr:NAD(P)-dependent oxidoreductase [Acidobacteriaceae bacterium]